MYTLHGHCGPITSVFIDHMDGRQSFAAGKFIHRMFTQAQCFLILRLITIFMLKLYSFVSIGSGSQDGMLCVWDLTTGACVYSIQAHDGAVLSLAYSPSYVVSMGSDEKLCVWERFHGHLINTINLVGF